MSPRTSFLLLFLAAALLFTIPAFTRDLWRPDEPRYAEVAREMVASGDYLVPRVNGEVYKEKPPLLFWLIALASWPAGGVTELAARLPSIGAALLSVALTFGLARRMFGDRAGLWSAAVLATSYRFWWESNVGQIDMLLTACTTLSFYALWRWYETPRAGWAATFYAGAALGLMAKGPPALLIVGLGAGAFLWTQPDARRGLRLWAGLPLAAAPVLVWFLLARSAAGGDVSRELSGTASRQILSRIFEGVSHPHAPWYYLLSFPIEWFPWSLFAPWVVVHAWRTRKESPATRLVLAWTIPALIFFHLSVEKRHVYLLPLFPAFAVLSARAIGALVDARRFAWMRATAAICFSLFLALSSIPFFPDLLPVRIEWDNRLLSFAATGIFSAGAIVLTQRARAWAHWPAILASLSAAVYFIGAVTLFPLIDSGKSARTFCEPVRILARAGALNIYNLGPLREEYLFYTQAVHTIVLAAPNASSFTASDGLTAQEMALKVRRTMAQACAAIPLASYTAPDASERKALTEARDLALAGAALPGDDGAQYAAAVRVEVAELMEKLRAPGAAVVLARNEDWRWVLSFVEDASFLVVLEDRRVSDRFMLLLANPAAIEVLRREEKEAAAPLHAFEQRIPVP